MPQSGEDSETLLNMKDEVATLKKLEEEMAKVLEEALRKNVFIVQFRKKHTQLLFLLGPM